MENIIVSASDNGDKQGVIRTSVNLTNEGVPPVKVPSFIFLDKIKIISPSGTMSIINSPDF